jgi:hypothetical protein
MNGNYKFEDMFMQFVSIFWVVNLSVISFCLVRQAPKHSYAETRKIMQKAFRVPIEALFDDFEEEPVASGSIAQVCIIVQRSSIYIAVSGHDLCYTSRWIVRWFLFNVLISLYNLFVVVIMHRSIGLC